MQKPDAPDGEYLFSPAGIILFLGAHAHLQCDEISAIDKGKAYIGLRRILAAAQSGGFNQGDILETMIANGDTSPRVKEIAHAAGKAAGADTIQAIIKKLWQ